MCRLSLSVDPGAGSAMYQYFVKIVPTIYESLDGNVINTNQFSVTEHTRMLPPGDKSGLPGTGSTLSLLKSWAQW